MACPVKSAVLESRPNFLNTSVMVIDGFTSEHKNTTLMIKKKYRSTKLWCFLEFYKKTNKAGQQEIQYQWGHSTSIYTPSITHLCVSLDRFHHSRCRKSKTFGSDASPTIPSSLKRELLNNLLKNGCPVLTGAQCFCLCARDLVNFSAFFEDVATLNGLELQVASHSSVDEQLDKLTCVIEREREERCNWVGGVVPLRTQSTCICTRWVYDQKALYHNWLISHS